MIPTIKDVWWLMFHVARRAYFVCRDVMRVIVTGVGGGWMVTLGGFEEWCVGTMAHSDRCSIFCLIFGEVHTVGVLVGSDRCCRFVGRRELFMIWIGC